LYAVPTREAVRLVSLAGAWSKRPNLLNFKKTKDSMVIISAGLLPEQTEEQEDVANAYSLILKMRLSSSGLAESTSAAVKHWVFMTATIPRHPTFRRLLHKIAQPRTCIGGFRPCRGWDWQADGFAVHDRRGRLTGRAVEPFSAEDNFHWRRNRMGLR
jgi:hypothetical protein